MALFDRQFYFPTRARYGSPEEEGLEYESVRFGTGDGVTLAGLWFPAGGEVRGVVVHCHGNAGNVSGHFPHAAWLAAEGFAVLCFDYRGYGESEGRVTREGTIVDAHAAVEYVKSRGDVDPRTVALFGQSLGGAVALVVAAERDDVAGVAVDGPFSDYQEEVKWVLQRKWYTWGVARLIARWGISRGRDPIDVVERISPAPLLLLHGTADRVCPWEMSQDLYDRAAEPKAIWLIPDADHYQALDELADLTRPRLVRFFEACCQAALISSK